MMPVSVLVEGLSDEPVAKKLLRHAGLEVGTIYGKKGKAHLLKRLPHYNNAAQFSPWFVIVDLDQDTLCASEAIRLWLPHPSPWMRCRIAVQAIESWLLADGRNLAQYLSVSETKLHHLPDQHADPKEALINLARQSRSTIIRHDMVPRPNSGARVGPLYVPRLNEFTEKFWDSVIAAEKSESLHRCIQALKTIASQM